jgi:hypothetical protein
MRGRSRALIAAVILLAWAAGLGALARRELFASRSDLLAQAAMRLSPGATFYAVEQQGRQIGFASSTIDTVQNGIDVTDYYVADFSTAGKRHRETTRSVSKLSRALVLRHFDVLAESPGSAKHTGGRADGDSAIVFAQRDSVAGVYVDSQRVRVLGPVLPAGLVPMALALGERPRVGHSYAFQMVVPESPAQHGEIQLRITAESLFTVVDSAKFDAARRSWLAATTDTVRAWHVEAAGTAPVNEWIDVQGRMVQSVRAGGITLKRMAYEIAFENWRKAQDSVAAGSGSGPGGSTSASFLERTAIAAGVDVGKSNLQSLRVRVKGLFDTEYRSLSIKGGRQALAGQTVTVTRESESQLVPSYSLLGDNAAIKKQFPRELSDEPGLQAHEMRVVQLAISIAGMDRDPRVIAAKMNAWVFHNVKREVAPGPPDALQVLATRRGDAIELTQLFTALARALGIPTRIATGVVYAGGKFYYHAWPEVYLRDWTAVDPTFGQFPADASHLRLVLGGVPNQAQLLDIMGRVKLDVLQQTEGRPLKAATGKK